MPNTATTPSTESRRDIINHTRWQAKAVANLLSAVHLLPEADQQTTIKTAAALAEELTGFLVTLTARGAA
jgi:hypothetical protein